MVGQTGGAVGFLEDHFTTYQFMPTYLPPYTCLPICHHVSLWDLRTLTYFLPVLLAAGRRHIALAVFLLPFGTPPMCLPICLCAFAPLPCPHCLYLPFAFWVAGWRGKVGVWLVGGGGSFTPPSSLCLLLPHLCPRPFTTYLYLFSSLEQCSIAHGKHAIYHFPLYLIPTLNLHMPCMCHPCYSWHLTF